MTTAKVPIDDLASWIGGNPEIASRVVELMEQGKSRDEILDWLDNEYHEWKDAPKLPEYLLMVDAKVTNNGGFRSLSQDVFRHCFPFDAK